MRTILTITVLAMIAGCASQSQPIVDLQGVDRALYEADLADCQAYANEVRIGPGMARGAAAGAVIGGAIGSIDGEADRGAGYGGIIGGARGAGAASRKQHRVLRRCLSGRGYRVLD